jgi:multicomponent Na+:H+ antiporter subunit E
MRLVPARSALSRCAAAWSWGFITWVLLTWSATAEQLIAGAGFAAAVAAFTVPLGEVVGPWRFLSPRTGWAVLRLLAQSSVRIVRANVGLSRRIWTPSLPLRSGMVIVPTAARTDGALAAVGLISSLVVDNQLVDLDRRRHQLQYHCVDVPPGPGSRRAGRINRPIEMLLPSTASRR